VRRLLIYLIRAPYLFNKGSNCSCHHHLQVYRAAAADSAAWQRQEHFEIAAEVAAEQAASRRARVDATMRQAEVADTMRALYSDAWDTSKRARVQARAVRGQARARAVKDRAFAAAFVRQANLLSSNVQAGERAALEGYHATVRAEHVQARMADGDETSEAVRAARVHSLAVNQDKAADARRGGFTRAHQDLAEEADEVARNVVARRRGEGRERTQRTGPAGGATVAAARTRQRVPLPLSSVVSAADTRTHGRGSGEAGGGTPRDAAEAGELHSSRRDWPDDGGASARSGGSGAAGTLPDYLPTFPFAKGANLTLTQRDKPIGMVFS
jgi:hypothetical protein